jgi:hypothetical protein
MQVLEGKVPIDSGFELGFVDPFRDPCNLANPNETAIAEDACEKRFFWRSGPGIFDVPRLKGIDKAADFSVPSSQPGIMRVSAPYPMKAMRSQ